MNEIKRKKTNVVNIIGDYLAFVVTFLEEKDSIRLIQVWIEWKNDLEDSSRIIWRQFLLNRFLYIPEIKISYFDYMKEIKSSKSKRSRDPNLFVIREENFDFKTGMSKIGGNPDLPKFMEYPTYHSLY